MFLFCSGRFRLATCYHACGPAEGFPAIVEAAPPEMELDEVTAPTLRTRAVEEGDEQSATKRSMVRLEQRWSDAVSSAIKRKAEDELNRPSPVGLETPNTGGSSSSGPGPGMIGLVSMDDREEEENWSNEVFDAMVDIKCVNNLFA